MKSLIQSSLFTAALFASASTFAADVSGKWVGQAGQSEIVFEFRAQGEQLTGTLNNAAAAGATEIKDGKVKGDTISFHVVRSLNNTEAKVEWTGKLEGEELKLQRAAVAGNAATEVVAKRAK